MPWRDGGESRKKYIDGIWLNPKCCDTMGNQQPSLEQRKVQRLSVRSRVTSLWLSEVVSIRKDDDIVCSHRKL